MISQQITHHISLYKNAASQPRSTRPSSTIPIHSTSPSDAFTSPTVPISICTTPQDPVIVTPKKAFPKSVKTGFHPATENTSATPKCISPNLVSSPKKWHLSLHERESSRNLFDLKWLGAVPSFVPTRIIWNWSLRSLGGCLR